MKRRKQTKAKTTYTIKPEMVQICVRSGQLPNLGANIQRAAATFITRSSAFFFGCFGCCWEGCIGDGAEIR